jgi:serine/threonine-protein kinase
LRSEQKATAQEIEDDLREVALRQRESSWAQAYIALGRARGRLGRSGPTELYRRLDKARSDLDQARREQELVTLLDDIHLKRVTLVEGRFNPAAQRRFNKARADRDYEVAFHDAGLGTPYDDPAPVAARVASSAARKPLVSSFPDNPHPR